MTATGLHLDLKSASKILDLINLLNRTTGRETIVIDGEQFVATWGADEDKLLRVTVSNNS